MHQKINDFIACKNAYLYSKSLIIFTIINIKNANNLKNIKDVVILNHECNIGGFFSSIYFLKKYKIEYNYILKLHSKGETSKLFHQSIFNKCDTIIMNFNKLNINCDKFMI